MTDADNLLARCWTKLWIEADPTGIDELVHDPYVRHGPDGAVTMSSDEYARHVVRITQHLRGTAIDIDHLQQVDDMLYARFTLRGMNVQTGAPVSIAWLGQYRVVDGRLAESWALRETDFAW